MNLRNTTAAERAAIREAIRIIDNGGYYNDFKNKRWTGPRRGVYKTAYIKDRSGIVVKQGPLIQLQGEMKLWNKTGRTKYRRFRKYITRSFGIYKGWLFQRLVKGTQRCSSYDRCGAVAYDIGISDHGNHNHRHIKGKPIWFDTNTYC